MMMVMMMVMINDLHNRISTEWKSTIKKTHTLAPLEFLKHVSDMFDKHKMLLIRINKPFTCSRCFICILCSVHVIFTYHVSKGSWAFLS